MPQFERDSPPEVERFFEALLARDGAGGSWLGPLLRAAPRGAAHLGELADAPGWLEVPLAVRTETGRRGAFEYPVAPTRQLLAWCIDHPDELAWSQEPSASSETIRLRRALIDDDPPGVRARAQDRAHDLLRRSTPLQRAWWRFEEVHVADCVLITDRLVVVVQGRAGDRPAGPSTPWLPGRSGLVRDLEAARRFADGGKAWGVLVIAGGPVADGDPEAVAAAVEAGAPHLRAAERAELADGFLGALTWEQAAEATGLPADHAAGAER